MCRAPAEGEYERHRLLRHNRRSGGAYQEGEVAANGHTAINVAALDPATLAGLDTLYVTNPDNGGFAATYLANQSNIEAAVAQGMNLIIFDRAVTNAQMALPVGSGIIVVRDFANDTAVDLAANAPRLVHQRSGRYN